MRFAETPLLPDPDEASEWLRTELSDPAYAAAEPTLFDRVARAVFDFFGGLFTLSPGGEAGPVVIVLIAVTVITLLIIAFLIWGLPRLRARSRVADDNLLFDQDSGRSASQLRADAAVAAQRADWVGAIVLRFRALARALAERGAVNAGPGATVHAFAAEATRAFPDQAAELDAVAAVFDDVRYLRQPGTESAYRAVVALDDRLSATRPAVLAPIGAEG